MAKSVTSAATSSKTVELEARHLVDRHCHEYEPLARILIDSTIKLKPKTDNTAANAAIDDFMRMANGVWIAPFIVTETGLLELSAWEGKVHLGFIGTQKKGQGDGSRLLDLLCRAADRHGVTIDGSLQAGKGGLSKSQLAQWYKRHGFKVSGDALLRPPHQP